MPSTITETFIPRSSVTFYESFGMIRIDKKLFRVATLFRHQWEHAKKTNVFRLDRFLRVWDF